MGGGGGGVGKGADSCSSLVNLISHLRYGYSIRTFVHSIYIYILHRHSCAPPPVHTTSTAVTSAPLHLKKVSSLFCINITSKSESTRRHRGKVSPRGGTALAPSISLEISHSRAAARRRPIYHPAIKSTHYHIQCCTTRRPVNFHYHTFFPIDHRLPLINRKSRR